MGLSILSASVHRLYLFSDLVQGELCLAVSLALPVKGVHLILGNRQAGGCVARCSSTSFNLVPVITININININITVTQMSVMVRVSTLHDFPEVFVACVVTHAGARAGGEPDGVGVMEEPCVNLSDFPLSVSHAELVEAAL